MNDRKRKTLSIWTTVVKENVYNLYVAEDIFPADGL